MPNHVRNEIFFEGLTTEVEDSILSKIEGANGPVDFESLIPMPLHIWRGNVSIPIEERFGKHNCGLTWAHQNWGTKWNAYKIRVERSSRKLVIKFTTAWSPPYPFLVALFQATSLPFRYLVADEGESLAREGRFFADGRFGQGWEEGPANAEDQARFYPEHDSEEEDD